MGRAGWEHGVDGPPGLCLSPTYLLCKSHLMTEAGEIKRPIDLKRISVPSSAADGICSAACP